MAEEVFEVINEKAFVSSEYPLIIVVRKKSKHPFLLHQLNVLHRYHQGTTLTVYSIFE